MSARLRTSLIIQDKDYDNMADRVRAITTMLNGHADDLTENSTRRAYIHGGGDYEQKRHDRVAVLKKISNLIPRRKVAARHGLFG